MREYQWALYHHALAAIEREDLNEEDREMLRIFTRGLDDPGLSAEFDQNMIFFWRLLGEAMARRREHRQAAKERRIRAKGGVVKAQRRALGDPNAWMTPIFDAAWSCLEADCRKRIGRKVLLWKAESLAKDHPRRAELTEHQARAYLSARGTKKPGDVLSSPPTSVKYSRILP